MRSTGFYTPGGLTSEPRVELFELRGVSGVRVRVGISELDPVGLETINKNQKESKRIKVSEPYSESQVVAQLKQGMPLAYHLYLEASRPAAAADWLNRV